MYHYYYTFILDLNFKFKLYKTILIVLNKGKSIINILLPCTKLRKRKIIKNTFWKWMNRVSYNFRTKYNIEHFIINTHVFLFLMFIYSENCCNHNIIPANLYIHYEVNCVKVTFLRTTEVQRSEWNKIILSITKVMRIKIRS